MKFSEHFGLNRMQPELDFVDIDPARDLPLFIDPYAFSKQKDTWSILCHNDVVSFFQAAVDAIRGNNHQRARMLLDNLSEPHDTCLGLSRGRPQGRGVSGKQAFYLYRALADSEAVRTGFITEISDCELLIEGIGHDKISDITTNVIRRHLIRYTQDQCGLHGIELRGEVASGRIWAPELGEWTQEYVRLPVIDGRQIVLVPKFSVRRKMSLDHQEYYSQFVLNFLRQEHLNAASGLVKVLKSGRRVVYKRDLAARYPISKEFLYRFSREHPEVLRAYKTSAATSKQVGDSEIEDVDETMLARAIAERLRAIRPGARSATEFHHLMVGVLEFLFYPNLMYPKKEREIHEGRKRIDISYTNAALGGIFLRAHSAPAIRANSVMVECKNYGQDPANPELDQLAGRFSETRGWFGILVARSFADRALFLARCRDTARDNRGWIIPLVDEDIFRLLGMIESGRRRDIDFYLERIFQELQS